MLDVKNLISEIYLKNGLIRTANSLSFSINRGETLGLVGESGSGKTQTALNLIGLSNSYPGVVSGEARFSFGDSIFKPLEHLKKFTYKKNGRFWKNNDGWIKQQNRLFKNIWGNKISIIFLADLGFKNFGSKITLTLRKFFFKNSL